MTFAGKLGRVAGCVALLMAAQLGYGQMQTGERPRPTQADLQGKRTPEVSDLAKDNLGRVAASSFQIRAVLVGNTGLLVELKRWVAKEATDNGQVVEDSNLSDQAIFDRLDKDVAFRSVATRLLQRYGYLLPSANPDSDLGKQQDLVLKERARRLVAIEAQEDAQSIQPMDQDRGLQRTGVCNSQDQSQDQSQGQNEDCPRPGSQRFQPAAPNRNQAPGNEVNPNLPPEQQQSPAPSRTLRTEFSPEGLDPRDRSAAGELELASSSSRAGTGSDSRLGSPAPGLSASDSMASTRSGTGSLYADGMRGMTTGGNDGNRYATDVPSRSLHGSAPRSRSIEEDVNPVKMVRPAESVCRCPFAVRHVRTSGGLAASGAALRPRRIPQHHESAGCDSHGPSRGAGLRGGNGRQSGSIDLWGSVSQRLVRLVDREGRISLPEIGPLLVSGKNLADVQLEVQRALRTEFRDVSADVSLSRLRTVRVYVVGEVAQPGAYDISSLSTPLNALFAAGGVTGRGSLRALKHFRGKQLVEQVDAYDLLLHGVRSDLKRLENGDTLTGAADWAAGDGRRNGAAPGGI